MTDDGYFNLSGKVIACVTTLENFTPMIISTEYNLFIKFFMVRICKGSKKKSIVQGGLTYF